MRQIAARRPLPLLMLCLLTISLVVLLNLKEIMLLNGLLVLMLVLFILSYLTIFLLKVVQVVGLTSNNILLLDKKIFSEEKLV